MGKMKKLTSFAVRISAIATHLRSRPSKCCLIRGIRITLAVIAETNFFLNSFKYHAKVVTFAILIPTLEQKRREKWQIRH